MNTTDIILAQLLITSDNSNRIIESEMDEVSPASRHIVSADFTSSIIKNVYNKLYFRDLIGIQVMTKPIDLITIDNNEIEVRANTSKFPTNFIFDNIDLDKLYQDLALDLNETILSYIHNVAPNFGHFDQSKIVLPNVPTFVSEIHQELGKMLLSAISEINANWMVISPMVLALLINSNDGLFERHPNIQKFDNNVGIFNKTVEVYVDNTASKSVLIGYKKSDNYSGAYFSPYDLIVRTGIINNPTTMTPMVSFMTRYGFLEHTGDKNPSDFFRSVSINYDTVSFI